MSEAPVFERLALIGVGLIGASIALAARRGGAAGEVAGFDASAQARDDLAALGLLDTVCDSAEEAARGADLVILCTPVGAMEAVAREIGPALAPGVVVSDAGSVKAHLVEALRPALPEGVAFIPAHPISGSEKSGPAAGYAELFDNRWCILTPPANAPGRAVARLSAFWERLGAKVATMDPAHHDRVLAVTSHAPHLLAYTLVGLANHMEEVTESEIIQFSAGGFRDFTRIAASDPTMWRDVFLTNREAVLEILGTFSEELFALQRAIRNGDGAALHAYFTRTRAIRRAVIEAGQDVAAPDFGRLAAKDGDA